MIKVAVIGVGAAILAAWLKSVKQEYALWRIFGAGILLSVFVAGNQFQLFYEALLNICPT